MKAFEDFKNYDPSFWAFVKFVSEKLGYSLRGARSVKSYTYDEIERLCRNNNVQMDKMTIKQVVKYSQMRAELLNEFVENRLMTAEKASQLYNDWQSLHRMNNYLCKLPMNKQKGEKRQVAYFTALINIIAEKTIREITGKTNELGFDDDPRGLAYSIDNGKIIGASSRRFDGAYPSITNPKIVWEIKEYYYATTFGSRIADAVYETQLDGYEFDELYRRTGRKVYHVLFIDAYKTWWEDGKSYLCRLIDALNSGVVDEIIVGEEVLTRWEQLLKEILVSK